MLRRPPLRATVTTVAAAVVLVGGADLASYAATGQALILGHSNSAGGTTSLKNSGHGPALSLKSAKSAPSLVVSSKKLVKHLNADTVHGVPASVVAPKNYQINVAKAGSTFNGERIVTAPVPPGIYQITLSGAIVPDTTSAVQCFLGNKKFLTATHPENHVDWIYAADYDANGTTGGVTLNAVGTATIGKKVTLFVACIGSGGSNQVLLPVTGNLTRVNGISKLKSKVLPASSAKGRLLGR